MGLHPTSLLIWNEMRDQQLCVLPQGHNTTLAEKSLSLSMQPVNPSDYLRAELCYAMLCYTTLYRKIMGKKVNFFLGRYIGSGWEGVNFPHSRLYSAMLCACS